MYGTYCDQSFVVHWIRGLGWNEGGHNSTEEISFLGYSRISASMVWL